MTSKTPHMNFENQFLIAMPQLKDSFFAGTVTYMWKHSADGALGIVINKPLAASVSDIFDELNIVCDTEAEYFAEQKVLAGGPVERDKGFILHNSSKLWDSSVSISSEISLCTSRTILEDIANGNGPDKYVIALGCAGWDAGQLEREIAENSWLTAPAKSDLLFSNNYNTMASTAAAQLGITLNQISPEAGHS
jgi:putative transcriptional regulator